MAACTTQIDFAPTFRRDQLEGDWSKHFQNQLGHVIELARDLFGMKGILVVVAQADIPRLGVHAGGFQKGLELHAGLTYHVGPAALDRCRCRSRGHLAQRLRRDFAHRSRTTTRHRVKVSHRRCGSRGNGDSSGPQRPQFLLQTVKPLHQIRRNAGCRR
ncbi:hypothetical protein DEDE109153_18200 [Deinococcus deserti]